MKALSLRSTDSSFYFIMSLVAAAAVFFGFRLTVDENLLHPDWPRPLILWVHAVLFAIWIPLFVVQTFLVRSRQVAWHRRLGTWSLGIGAAIPVLGIAATIDMARLRAQHGEADAAAFLPIGFMDMLAFAVAFVLGAALRLNREAHRRLMFVATCALAAAGFLRIFQPLLPGMYAGSLCATILLLIAAARDLIVNRRIHPVYVAALPLYAVGEGIAIYLNASPRWLALGNELIR